MHFYVFHLLINTETERNWNVGSSTLHVFRLFFSPGTSKRNFFFIWQVVCVLLRTRGMGQRRSPCKAFSVTDIKTIKELKVFHFQSFDIGTERELERSYRQSVNKFWRFGVNIKGFTCMQFFIPLYKTGAGWICQLSIKSGSWF